MAQPKGRGQEEKIMETIRIAAHVTIGWGKEGSVLGGVPEQVVARGSKTLAEASDYDIDRAVMSRVCDGRLLAAELMRRYPHGPTRHYRRAIDAAHELLARGELDRAWVESWSGVWERAEILGGEVAEFRRAGLPNGEFGEYVTLDAALDAIGATDPEDRAAIRDLLLCRVPLDAHRAWSEDASRGGAESAYYVRGPFEGLLSVWRGDTREVWRPEVGTIRSAARYTGVPVADLRLRAVTPAPRVGGGVVEVTDDALGHYPACAHRPESYVAEIASATPADQRWFTVWRAYPARTHACPHCTRGRE